MYYYSSGTVVESYNNNNIIYKTAHKVCPYLTVVMCVSIYFCSVHFCTVAEGKPLGSRGGGGGGEGRGMDWEREREREESVVALCEELEKEF